MRSRFIAALRAQNCLTHKSTSETAINIRFIAALRAQNCLTYESMSEMTINLRFIAALRAQNRLTHESMSENKSFCGAFFKKRPLVAFRCHNL